LCRVEIRRQPAPAIREPQFVGAIRGPLQADEDRTAIVRGIGVFQGIGDQFMRDHGQRNRTAAGNLQRLRRDLDTVPETAIGFLALLADLAKKTRKFDTAGVIALIQLLIDASDRENPVAGARELIARLGIGDVTALQIEHAG
jgi:hypothetical protein